MKSRSRRSSPPAMPCPPAPRDAHVRRTRHMSGVSIRSPFVVLACMVIGLSAIPNAQVPDGPLRLRASITEVTSSGASRMHGLEITLDRYSSANEKAELIDTMIKGG